MDESEKNRNAKSFIIKEGKGDSNYGKTSEEIIKEDLEGGFDKALPPDVLPKFRIFAYVFNALRYVVSYVVWYYIVKYIVDKIFSITNNYYVFVITTTTFLLNIFIIYYRRQKSASEK